MVRPVLGLSAFAAIIATATWLVDATAAQAIVLGLSMLGAIEVYELIVGKP